jgi:hypothetical protein
MPGLLVSATGVVWDAQSQREPHRAVPVWRLQPIQTVPVIKTREVPQPAPVWAAPLAQALEEAERTLPVFYEQERMDVRA